MEQSLWIVNVMGVYSGCVTYVYMTSTLAVADCQTDTSLVSVTAKSGKQDGQIRSAVRYSWHFNLNEGIIDLTYLYALHTEYRFSTVRLSLTLITFIYVFCMLTSITFGKDGSAVRHLPADRLPKISTWRHLAHRLFTKCSVNFRAYIGF